MKIKKPNLHGWCIILLTLCVLACGIATIDALKTTKTLKEEIETLKEEIEILGYQSENLEYWLFEYPEETTMIDGFPKVMEE